MFGGKPISARLEAGREARLAEYRQAYGLAAATQVRAHQIAAVVPGTEAAEQAQARANRAREALTELQDRWAYQDGRRLATLGAPRGDLHKLLREAGREERRGQDAFAPGSDSRAMTPAETCLQRAWQDVRSARPDLFQDGKPDLQSIMGVIGAADADTAARDWIVSCLRDDREQQAAEERERTAALAEARQPDAGARGYMEPDPDDPAFQCAMPDREAGS